MNAPSAFSRACPLKRGAPTQWERKRVPELRIVDEQLWDAVKRRQDAVAFDMGRDDQGNALNRCFIDG
jgi:hypothetical protein